MNNDDAGAGEDALRQRIKALEAELARLSVFHKPLHPCHCRAPIIGEWASQRAFCKLCKGYITAAYIVGLQNELGGYYRGQS